jgi:hypothetical protein
LVAFAIANVEPAARLFSVKESDCVVVDKPAKVTAVEPALAMFKVKVCPAAISASAIFTFTASTLVKVKPDKEVAAEIEPVKLKVSVPVPPATVSPVPKVVVRALNTSLPAPPTKESKLVVKVCDVPAVPAAANVPPVLPAVWDKA